MAGQGIRPGAAAGFFRRRLLLGAAGFERQEAKGQHDQHGVVVEAAPTAAFAVIRPEFFFHLLVALLDLPTLVPEPSGPPARGAR